MEPWDVEGQSGVRFTEDGRGRYSSYSGDVTWYTESIWAAGSTFRPLKVEKTIRNTKGVVIGTERKNFDSTNRSVRFERIVGARAESKNLQTPVDTLPPEGIAGILRALPFDQKAAFSAHLMSNEPRIYSVTFEVRRRERVRIQAGEFECYKVEVVPHLGVLNIAKIFIGETYFWFTVAPPHFWVKYEGYENGLGTPRIRMELGSYQPE